MDVTIASCMITFFLHGVTVEVEHAGASCPDAEHVRVEQVDYGVEVEIEGATVRVYNPPDPAPANIG